MLWLCIIILLILLFFGLSYSVYRETFYNKNNKDITHCVMKGKDYEPFHDQMVNAIEEVVKIPYESVYIKSNDGLKLFGRVYERNENGPVHIEFHGYKSNGIRDFSGGLRLALERNETVVLIDERAHGKSEGHTLTFGIKERQDVVTWIKYVTDRFGKDTPIFLEGVSMGAATVLMASGMNLPGNIRGIWADCPFSKPIDIIDLTAKKMMKYSKILHPFFYVAASIFGGFYLDEISAAESVKNTKCPICIIHGTEDHFVPIEMAREIRNSNKESVTLIEVEGAPHGLSYLVDYELYKTSFNRFIDSNL